MTMNVAVTTIATAPCRYCRHRAGAGECATCIYNARSLGKDNNFSPEAPAREPKKGPAKKASPSRRRHGRSRKGSRAAVRE